MQSVAQRRGEVKAVTSDAPNWLLGRYGPLYHVLDAGSPDGGRIGRRWTHPTVNLCKGRKSSRGAVARVRQLGRFREVLFSVKGFAGTETQAKVRVVAQEPPARELYWSEQAHEWAVVHTEQVAASESGRRVEENRERACRRARTMVRRLCLAYNLSYLWTLTFAEDVTELKDAWKRWQAFAWRARRQGVLPRQWVVIPELQEQRGVWHFHVAVPCFVPYERVRDVWGQGHVSLTHPGAAKGGSYIGKYVTKAFASMDGQHRYRRALRMPLREAVDVEVATGERAWQDVLELVGPTLLGQAYLGEQGWWWLLGVGSEVAIDEAPLTWYRQDVGECSPTTGGGSQRGTGTVRRGGSNQP